jgi:[acyl-carrier-protein] S-malonyltransferase
MTNFASPQIGVIANVDASEQRDPAMLKSNLVQQLTAPVLWSKSMQKLVDQGYDRFIEIGPGTVLAGLLKRVAKSATRISIGKAEEVAAVV